MRKLAFWITLLASFALLAALPAAAQDAAAQDAGTAYLRVLHLDTTSTLTAFNLEGGRRIFASLAAGTASDYTLMETNRSTYATLTFTPVSGRFGFNREWTIPPLAPGHYTAAVVGRSTDITLQLVIIDEDQVCADKIAAGSCLIMINNITNSPPLTFSASGTPMFDSAAYRHVVVNGVPARSYLDVRAVSADDPQRGLFQLGRGFFPPNVITLYALTGSFSTGSFSNLNVATLRRAAVDSMTFLRSLTADLQLTGGDRLVAAENIVAVLEQSRFEQLLTDSQLPLTLFAPLDEAVVDVADLYACALANPGALRTLILNHIVAGSYSPSQLRNAGQISTMAGTNHTIRAASAGVFIDDTFVSDEMAYPTTNGYVYLIDKVLIPDGFADELCTSG